jgi:hypothetical protein
MTGPDSDIFRVGALIGVARVVSEYRGANTRLLAIITDCHSTIIKSPLSKTELAHSMSGVSRLAWNWLRWFEMTVH